MCQSTTSDDCDFCDPTLMDKRIIRDPGGQDGFPTTPGQDQVDYLMSLTQYDIAPYNDRDVNSFGSILDSTFVSVPNYTSPTLHAQVRWVSQHIKEFPLQRFDKIQIRDIAYRSLYSSFVLVPYMLYSVNFTCTVSPVLFHLYCCTCTVAPVLLYLYCCTCTVVPVLLHLPVLLYLYCCTCTVSPVLFTCTVAPVLLHLYCLPVLLYLYCCTCLYCLPVLLHLYCLPVLLHLYYFTCHRYISGSTVR